MKRGINRFFDDRQEIQLLPLQAIDHQDRPYATIPMWWRNDRLDRSIRQIGIVSPIRIQRKKSGYRVISGYQRAAVAHRLKIPQVPCLLIDNSVAKPLSLFLENLWENIGSRELHELEKARALALFYRRFGISEREVIESYLPLLGMKSSRYHLNRLLEIDSLPERLKMASVENDVVLDLALKISKWSQEEQATALELIRDLQPGRNKQKILLDLLDDLRVLLQTSVVEIWEEVSKNVPDDGSQPAQRLDQTIECLRRQKNPRLLQHEERYRKLRGQLCIPPSIQINPPSFFEGASLSFSFRASSPRELDQITSKLRELRGRRELNEIFDLL